MGAELGSIPAALEQNPRPSENILQLSSPLSCNRFLPDHRLMGRNDEGDGYYVLQFYCEGAWPGKECRRGCGLVRAVQGEIEKYG